MSLVERLEELARRAGSQRQLAKSAGLSPNHVGAILTRLRADPSRTIDADTLAALARAGGVSVDWLMRGGDNDAADGLREYTVEPSHDGRRVPVLRNLPNWGELVEGALVLDPKLPQWALDELGSKSPFLAGQLTPSAVRDLARVILKHSAPPKGQSR